MVIVTRESYDSALITGKQKGLESLSEIKTASDGADATWRCTSLQTVAPETGNACLPTSDVLLEFILCSGRPSCTFSGFMSVDNATDS